MGGRLDNFTVALLEHRYGPQLTQLLAREGATVLSCPLVKETPIEDHEGAWRFIDFCEGTPVDYIVFYTGVGVDFLFRAFDKPDLIARSKIVARGPKAVAALKRAGVRVDFVADAPTTAGIAETLLREDVAGRTVLVQSFGEQAPELVEILKSRGANVRSVSLYRYTAASDQTAIGSLIDAILAKKVDAMIFTSAVQVGFLLDASMSRGVHNELRQRLANDVVIVSIGDVTGRALADAGVPPQVIPSEPKMAPMVQALAHFVEHKRKECSIPSSST